MKAIDVFSRIDRFQDRVLVHMFGKRKLNEYSINGIPFVELVHLSQQLVRCDRARNRKLTAVNAELFARLGFHVDVCGGGSVVPHQNYGQTGMNSTSF